MSKKKLKDFKVTSKIDKGNGTEEHILYITTKNAEEARLSVKHYYIVEKGYCLFDSVVKEL